MKTEEEREKEAETGNRLQPLFNRIALARIRDKKAEGFYIAGDAQKAANKATVLAVGPGHLDVATGHFTPCSLKVGETVMINPHLGSTARIDGVEVIFQLEVEILCVVKDPS